MNLRLLFSTLLVLSVAVLALGDIRADFSTWTPRTGPTPVIRRQGNLPNNFDFIIIGGGTAGSVLANRLSANRKVNVLLIESGTYQTNTLLAEIPVNWDRTPFSPFDHSYLNEGLENELNWNGGQRHVAAGKALGGGTIINTMMWVRGNHLDWDSLGIPGWTFNDVLPYFKKAETTDRFFTAPNGSFWHGHTGPVHVGPSGWQPPEDQRLVDAAASWGLPFNPDWNGATQIGVGFHEHTINNGIRVTSFDSYVLPVLNRNNLWVMDSSEVQKINFRFSGRQIIADSVLFFDNIAGTSYTVRAKKEIILSAGTIRSPQILQLSGIGPASELNRLGIPIIKEIAGVGQNLRDHPITTMSFGTAIPTDVPGSALDQAAFDQWVKNKTGVVASITARTNFFFRSAFAIDARPDAQIIVTPPGTGVFALCYLNKPRSTGHIRLFSKDPSDYPLVTANYMSDPDDLNAMMDIMNKTFQILQQPPIFAFPFGTFLSSKEALQTYILGDAASFVQANVGSGYHFIGTNRMGNIATDPTAVVDNRLRVAGVSSLRVVDASIFPNSPTGNTQYPTYMVAEKASDLILQDWNLL